MAYKHIFSIDPGGARNGFCYFKWDSETKRADTKMMRIYSTPEYEDVLKIIWGIGQVKPENPSEKPDVTVVAENFRVDSKVRGAVFQWDEVVVAQNLGKAKMVARWIGAQMILQEPAILALARKWAPAHLRIPKGHIPDDKSAWLHGVKYMMDRQLIPTPDQVTLFGQEML